MGFLSTIPWVSFHHTTTMGFLSTIPWVSFLPFHGVPFHPTMGSRSTVPLDSIIEYRYHGLPCSAVPVRQLHRTMGFHSTAPWETVVLYNGRPFHMSMLCRFESGSWGSDKLCQILSKFRQCGVVELLPETLFSLRTQLDVRLPQDLCHATVRASSHLQTFPLSHKYIHMNTPTDICCFS